MDADAPAATDSWAQEAYGCLVRPKMLLGQWATRTRRTSPDVHLRSTAWGLIEAFDELLALPLTMVHLEMTIRPEGQGVPVEDHEAAEADRRTALLDAVRDLRRQLRSAPFERLRAALRGRDPSIAQEFNARRDAAMERLAEWERLMVFLGAGAELDASLGQELVPEVSEDLPSGPSVPFDL